MSTEIELAAERAAPAGLDDARAAEREMLATTIRYALYAIPICVVIWVAIVSIALALADNGSYAVALPVAAGIGVIAGGFFGGLFAFLSKAERLEEADRRALHAEG